MEPRATRNCIVEESPDDLLEKADGIWWKSGRVVNIVRILEFGAIDRLRPGIGGILLAFGLGMLKLVQWFIHVAWHRDVDSPVGVISREGEAAEKRSVPVDGDGVQTAECGDEMVRRGVANVLDAGIVNNQR